MTPQEQLDVTLVTPPDIIDVPRSATRVSIVSSHRSEEILAELISQWDSSELAVFHADGFVHAGSHGWMLNRAAASDFVVVDLHNADENVLILIGALFRQSNCWITGTPNVSPYNLVKSWAGRCPHDRITSCVSSLVSAHDRAKYLK